MEAIILAIRLGLRRVWRGLLAFLDRNKLSNMPPVRTIAICLAIGLIVPIAMGIDRTPAALARTLADQRLERIAGMELPEVSPADITYCTEPAFFWKAHPTANSYRFRLFADGVLTHYTDNITKAHYLLPSPGELAVGPQYRFAVEAYDENGKTLGEQASSTFSIRAGDDELRAVHTNAARELDPDDAAYVMAGLYTEHGTVHDVRSALARYVSLARGDDETELARSILGQ